MMDVLHHLLYGIISFFIAFATGLTYMGASRVIVARIQNRYGPPLFQNFIDVIKLYRKRSAISHGIMFHLGPVIFITGTVTTLMFIPILKDNPNFHLLSFNGDIILVMYLMAFGSLGMALGVGQGANPYSVIGVTRGLSQMAGYEIPFALALIAVMIEAKSASMIKIMEFQSGGILSWFMFKNPLAFIAAILAMLGMFRNKPFDIVSAPSEIAAGPPAEFGGKYLGLMMTNNGVFAFVKLVFYADVFLGGATNFAGLIVKTFILFLIPLFIGVVNPRFRVEQAVRFFWKWPTFFGILGVIYAILK